MKLFGIISLISGTWAIASYLWYRAVYHWKHGGIPPVEAWIRTRHREQELNRELSKILGETESR